MEKEEIIQERNLSKKIFTACFITFFISIVMFILITVYEYAFTFEKFLLLFFIAITLFVLSFILCLIFYINFRYWCLEVSLLDILEKKKK